MRPDGPPPRYNAPAASASSFSWSSLFNYITLAILGGVFILGIGMGVAFSSTTTFTPENVASREFIDRSAPNPELCAQFGASAVAADMRVFLTLNPFSVYVSRPTMQPGCVLRRNNWAVLEQRKLVSNEQVSECRRRMNTFAFTGDLDKGDPKISCIYQNDGAENLFLGRSGMGSSNSEGDNF